MPFQLQDAPNQQGRIAIVTGANTGLGYETALGLAQKGATVVLACRDANKSQQAKQKIKKAVPDADIRELELDLGDLRAVREFARAYREQYDGLDLLVNNAGVMMPPYSQTEQGFELQMGVNYLGHFLLTGLLLEELEKKPGARVVTLASNAHKNGDIHFDDLHFEQEYSAWKAYAQSKLACLLFAYELQRRLEQSGSSVISVAAHPGASDTELSRHLPQWAMAAFGWFFRLFLVQSPADGAKPTLYAALGQDIEGGDYTGPDGWGEWKGEAVKVDSTERARDPELARRLWAVSEELVGESYL